MQISPSIAIVERADQCQHCRSTVTRILVLEKAHRVWKTVNWLCNGWVLHDCQLRKAA